MCVNLRRIKIPSLRLIGFVVYDKDAKYNRISSQIYDFFVFALTIKCDQYLEVNQYNLFLFNLFSERIDLSGTSGAGTTLHRSSRD